MARARLSSLGASAKCTVAYEGLVLEKRTRLSTGDAEDSEQRRQLAIVTGRLSDLTDRLAKTQLVDPRGQAPDAVRFGATVVVQKDSGEEMRVQIVGVDEANVAEGRVAFVAPIVYALTGKHGGESVTLRTPQGEEMLTVLSIAYD